jgi:imidazoleglycerol phosphate dehydratase HisB
MKGSSKRETKETLVDIVLETEGRGLCDADTGIELLDSMLRMLAEASGFDISVKAQGDLETGDHHTTEDVGITLGMALAKLKITGMGSAIVPCGECLAIAAIRFGKPGYRGDFDIKTQEIGSMEMENLGHFMRSLSYNGKFTLRIKAEGEDDRGKIDAIMAALGCALRDAVLRTTGSK